MANFCTGCGAPLSEGKKFCTECGTPVTEVAAEVMAENTVAIVPEAGPEISADTVAEAVAVTEAEPIQPLEAPKPQPQPQVSYQQPQAQAAYQQVQPQAAYQQQTTYQQPRQQTVYAQPVSQPVQARAVQAPPVYGADVPPAKGSKYEPITAWGYIGIMLLMCIPVIGFILTIIWACGGCRKVNKKSLARATLIMMAVGLVISLILGFVFKAIFNKAMEASGLDALMNQSESSVFDSGKDADDEEGLAGLLGSLGALSGDSSTNHSESSGGNGNYSGESDSSVNSGSGSSDTSDMEALGALAALFGGLSGSGSENSEALGDLAALSQLFAVAGAIEGENGEVDLEALLGAAENGNSDLGSLLSGVEQANQDAEKLNDGWPKSLRAYPDGTATALASYRTEISGTSKETMHQWIEDLKKDGFEYQDFYDFGMTEADMLGMDAWWGYDGETYLSVSYYDGVVTIDHTKELPDLESYFGG